FTPASVTTTNVASLNVAGGTLRAGDATGLNALTSINASTTVAKGATLDLNSFNTSVANLQGAGTVLTGTDASKALTVNAGNFAGSIQGADSLIKTTAGILVLSGANSYTGATAVNAGTLRAGAANVLPVGTALTVANAATFDLNNQAQAIGSLAGVAGSAVTLGSAALTTGGNNASTAFNGVISGTGSLVKTGTGTFALGGANSYTGATTVNAGTLQAGAANVLPASTAVTVAGGGTLDLNNQAQTIGSLAGAGAVTLGSAALTTGGANTSTAFTGAILGSGSLVKTGTGAFAVSGANTYTGATTVAQGTLSATAANALSAASAHTVAAGATLALNGNSQTVASLANSGVVSLVGAAPGTTLTVNGAYVGNGGTLALGTLLGANGTSDRLVLNGPNASASGSTNVAITNFGGLGALTSGNGIEVVTAQGGATSTKTAFALAGGHVDAGAFQYRLYAADAAGNGSSFYLRTQDGSTPVTPVTPVTATFPALSVPSYRAEVPVYSAMGNVLRQGDLAMLGNLHRRMGDEANVAAAPAAGATSASGAAGDTGWGSGNRRAWGRVFGGTTTIEQNGTVGTDTRASTTGFQTGVDLFANDRWNAGVYIGALRTDANVNGNFGLGGLSGYAGSFRADSQYLAGYATYQIPQGMYADFVLQYGRQDVTADALFKPSAKTKGDSLLASAEVGQRFAIGNGWAIEPQAQLVYHRLNLDNTGITGFTNVQQDPDSQILGRIGVRFAGDMMTSMGRFQPYARVNLWHGFGGTDTATFVGPAGATTISSRIGYTSTELAVGATLSVTKSVSLYSEVGKLFHSGGSDARVKTSVQGSLGVKFAF
ncbi:MAG: autotransporter outer membrane beta-barrel domain-containing protein, partial [Variovorax sp.]|nr:autotransporter outer membrane beta-barrel domain-containing protein [Variovorax sp.]